MLKLLAVYSVIAVVATREGPFEIAAPGQRYLVSNVTAQFIDAYATCKRYGYKLARERSANDTVDINAAIIEAGHNMSNHYIGGYLEHSNALFTDEWIWLETGEPFEYTSWFDHRTADTWFCVVKLPLLTFSFKWIAYFCDYQQYFICEK